MVFNKKSTNSKFLPQKIEDSIFLSFFVRSCGGEEASSKIDRVKMPKEFLKCQNKWGLPYQTLHFCAATNDYYFLLRYVREKLFHSLKIRLKNLAELDPRSILTITNMHIAQVSINPSKNQFA